MYELIYQVNGRDDEVIFRSDCVEDLTVCIYTFWKALKFDISYFRFLNTERGCIKLDFGQHTRFYKIQYPKDESWNVVAGKMNDKLQVLKKMN